MLQLFDGIAAPLIAGKFPTTKFNPFNVNIRMLNFSNENVPSSTPVIGEMGWS